MPDQGGTLPERLEKALHGSAQAVLIRGPVGCGRAILRDALVAAELDLDVDIRYVRCEESAADQDYEVARRLLAPAGEALAAGQATLPFLHDLSRVMIGLMSGGPQAIVIDDVQWCDEQSLRWLDFLLRRTQSLPLFILLSERTETGSRRRFALGDIFAHDRCTLLEMAPPNGTCTHRPLDSTAASMVARLDGRPRHVREVALAVAVLGDAGGEAVGMLAGVPEPSVTTALGVLEELGLLSPTGTEAILGDLPEDRLLYWRERAARILNDTGRGAEEIASQLLHLPELKEPWMGTVLREAAAAAHWDGRPQAVARYLRRIIADEPDDFGARMELADALTQVDPPAAVVVLEDTLERTTDAGHRAQLLYRLADVDSAMQLIGWGRGVSRDGKLPTTDDWTEWQGYAGNAIRTAALGGPAALAVDYARRAVNETDENASSCTTRATVAYVLSVADLPDEALGELDKIIEADVGDSPWASATVLTARAWTWNRIGEIAKSAGDASEAIRLTSQEDMALPKVALASALVAQGQDETAERLLGEVSPRWLEEFAYWTPIFLLTRAALHTYREDHENALEDALTCGRLLADSQVENAVFAPWWITASFQLARLGRGAEAEDAVAHGEELAARWGTARGTGYAQLARGAITPGKAGLDLLFAATETLATSPAKYQHAIAKSMLAQGLFQAGDVKGARKNFRQVVDLAVRCGAWALAAKARTLLVAAGGRMQAVRSSPIDALSLQERRISELAAGGATNREIADTLSLAVRTVEVHLTSVYRKLAISGRVELAPAFGSDRPE